MIEDTYSMLISKVDERRFKKSLEPEKEVTAAEAVAVVTVAKVTVAVATKSDSKEVSPKGGKKAKVAEEVKVQEAPKVQKKE